MPYLNRALRGWLDDHNWSYRRLADACLEIDPEDKMSSDVVRNAVMGHDQIRPGRIRLFEKVTRKYGDPISYEEMVEEDKKEGESDDSSPKEEPTHPPGRTNGGKGAGRGPKRVTDRVVA